MPDPTLQDSAQAFRAARDLLLLHRRDLAADERSTVKHPHPILADVMDRLPEYSLV